MNATILFFSATGITKKILDAFAGGLNCEVSQVDLTLPANRQNVPSLECDLVVMAVPVHGDRIHRFIYEYLSQLDGEGKPLVALSIYGNIGLGISLAQFAQLARENHFQLIGAGAFIGQHTYASGEIPVAYRRPDQQDLEQAREFGQRIRAKLDAGNLQSINLPAPGAPMFISKFPDSGIRFLIKQPSANKSTCKQCGLCAKHCPMAAINATTFRITEKKCIRCYACVRGCPESARRAEFRLKLFGTGFKFMGSKRKENRVYL
jgi:ferredoxin